MININVLFFKFLSYSPSKLYTILMHILVAIYLLKWFCDNFIGVAKEQLVVVFFTGKVFSLLLPLGEHGDLCSSDRLIVIPYVNR
jgi:hypothetical protein